jgi:hypothetical protein
MIGKLDSIIHNINNDSRFLLSVFDIQKNTSLYRFFEATRILEMYGSAENFFEELNANGHHHLRLSSHIKNGTGKKKIAESIEVNFTSQLKDKSFEEPVQKIQEPQETRPVQSFNSYPAMPMGNDLFSTFGLGAPQVMELMVKKNEADRLTLENSELRADNRSLKEQNEKFREEMLKEKYDYQKEKDKKGDTHALIGQIAGSLPAIMNYIKPVSAEGLNASQSIDYGSPTKNSFVEGIKQIDDDSLLMLASILSNSNTNTAFSNELINLLKKYKLWQ